MIHILGRRKLLSIIALMIAAPLVFYLVSPLWINVMVKEALPVRATPQLKPLAMGMFVDTDSFHRASGAATVIRLDDGSRLLRFEDFQTTNGPDLYVYLSSDRQTQDFLDLGRLKGNIGDQNYPIPADTDLARYRYVLIWCRAFTVLFGSADLST